MQSDNLVQALRNIMPIRVHNGPDYAEVYFSDGTEHRTQAMTMNPQDWQDIADAYAAITANETAQAAEIEVLRADRTTAMIEGARIALEAAQPLVDAAAAAIYGLPEMLEKNALSDEEGMVAQIQMALASFRALDPTQLIKEQTDAE